MQSLREQGLAKITGDVVIDHSYFAPPEGNRADFDAQPFRSYNVLPDALMVNFQTSRFTVIANTQRDQPLILVNPLPSNLVMRNQVRLGNGRCQGYDRGIAFDTPDPIDDPNTLVVQRRVSRGVRQLLDQSRDHDGAGLCLWHISHAVDAIGRRDRRRDANRNIAARRDACSTNTTRCRWPKSSGW